MCSQASWIAVSDEGDGCGYIRERIHWYVATVPDGVLPDNQDGEVQGFALLPPDQVQAWLKEGKLTAGHARALITAPNAVELARKVIEKNLSVRETEEFVRRQAEGSPAKPKAAKPEKDADTRALEGDLSAHLKMRVAINHAGTDGEPGDSGGAICSALQIG